MLSTLRDVTTSSVYGVTLAFLLCTSAVAQTPCFQSPEGVQGASAAACTRCSPGLCDSSCFTCDSLTAAATACNKGKSCSTTITIPNVAMSIGGESCPQGLGWAMRKINGTVNAHVACTDGKVTAINSVAYSATGAEATGALCNWSYKNMSVSASWAQGQAATLSIGSWPSGNTLITGLKATSSGTNFSLTANAAAPLANGSGYHHHSPVMVQLSITASCSCQ